PDPAFTISGLPQYTEQGIAINLVKYKLLNTFTHQQLEQSCDFHQCPAEHMLTLGEFSFCSRRMQNSCLCLDSADWSCAHHMHSPIKNNKKTSLAL
ncbi:unnamed protein product, partial [Staurois parvus]